MATITEVRTEALVPNDLILKTGQIKIESEEVFTKDLPNIPLPPPSKRPTEVLSVDKGTPDGHVPRDPRLIRLTGVHPFNVEPPLADLYQEGMVNVFIGFISLSPKWLHRVARN
jgi:nitrate reductase (NAD(P)H)